MAITNVSIVNSALAAIGEDPISSLTQNSKAARMANRIFEPQRDRTLMRYRWVFAITRTILAADPTAPEFGYSAKFRVPSDLLMLIGVRDELDGTPQYTARRASHKREGAFILSNDTTLPIVYIRRVTDPTEFDPAFSEVLSLQLAIKLAPNLTNSAATSDLKEQLSEAIRQARLNHAFQSTPEMIESSEWIDSRQWDTYAGPWRIGPVVG